MNMPQRDHWSPPCMVGANSLGLVLTVGTAVTLPAKAVMIASPEKARSRKFSRV